MNILRTDVISGYVQLKNHRHKNLKGPSPTLAVLGAGYLLLGSWVWVSIRWMVGKSCTIKRMVEAL